MSNPPENASRPLEILMETDKKAKFRVRFWLVGFRVLKPKRSRQEKAQLCGLEFPKASESPNSTHSSYALVLKIWQKSLMVTQIGLI
jgi:hypothetical protein